MPLASSPDGSGSRHRTRNAQAQADLRARRKQYIKSLEDTVAALESCVRQLRIKNSDLSRQQHDTSSSCLHIGGSSSSSSSSSNSHHQAGLIRSLTQENARLHQLLAEVGLTAASSAKLARVGKDYSSYPPSEGGGSSFDAAEATRLSQIIEAGLATARNGSLTTSTSTASGTQQPQLQSQQQQLHTSLPRWTDSQSIQAKHRRVSEAQAFASETKFELGLAPPVHASAQPLRSDPRRSFDGYASIDVTASAQHSLFPQPRQQQQQQQMSSMSQGGVDLVTPHVATHHGAPIAIPNQGFEGTTAVFLQNPNVQPSRSQQQQQQQQQGGGWCHSSPFSNTNPAAAAGTSGVNATTAPSESSLVSPSFGPCGSASSISASPLVRSEPDFHSWQAAYSALAESPSQASTISTQQQQQQETMSSSGFGDGASLMRTGTDESATTTTTSSTTTPTTSSARSSSLKRPLPLTNDDGSGSQQHQQHPLQLQPLDVALGMGGSSWFLPDAVVCNGGGGLSSSSSSSSSSIDRVPSGGANTVASFLFASEPSRVEYARPPSMMAF